MATAGVSPGARYPRGEVRSALLFVTPFFLGFVVFQLLPLLYSVLP